MNILAKIRDRRLPWTRRVLGMFAVAWLSLALQGCSIAVAEEHPCPACPPEHAQPETPCEVEPEPCTHLDGRDFDSRTPQVKVEDSPGDLPVVLATAWPEIDPKKSPAAIPISGTASYPGVPPPLNLLHCVFLD